MMSLNLEPVYGIFFSLIIFGEKEYMDVQFYIGAGIILLGVLGNIVFKYKKITSYFNGGIFGSPDKKHTIIKREIANGKIKFPALMFGDSKLDYNVAKLNNIDFLFVTQWTDLKNSKTFCEENLIPTVSYVSDII